MEQLNYDDYLHGYCHQWVLENFHQGDKIFVITDFDYEIEDYALVHCGLFRNGKFYDVRGELNTIDDVLDEFDYGEEMDVEIMSLSKFRKYCKNNGLI